MTVQDTSTLGVMANLDLTPPMAAAAKPAAAKPASRPVRRLPVPKDWPTWALVAAQIGILVGTVSLWEIAARTGWIDAFF